MSLLLALKQIDNMTRVEADIAAYRWAGSSPCEDCEKFRECEDKDNGCEDAIKWRKMYDDALKDFLKHVKE